MLAAHMDEIGFILVSDEEDGYFRFDNVGGSTYASCPVSRYGLDTSMWSALSVPNQSTDNRGRAQSQHHPG